MSLIGLRAATTPTRVGEGDIKDIAATRDGALHVVDWKQALAFEGRAFSLQFGTEDAPIDSTTLIDDQLVTALVDVPSGTIAMLYWAQVVVGTWQDGTLYNFLIEVDSGKNRFTSGGTAYTPLNLRTDKPIASLATARVGPDITVAAKTSGGSLELWRESVEVNVGNVADYWPPFEYNPDLLELVVGPASILLHFGATNVTDPTIYGSMHWFEIPSTSVV